MASVLKIGTRGSRLALIQTELVADALRAQHPELAVETVTITTKGDINQAPIPLDTVGKAWFTEEIEEALLAGAIDIAVHSLKDLPPELPEGLVALPVLAREDARDVLVANDSSATLATLPAGSIVGTDSLRRKALILEVRPDLVVKSIRGNIETRLRKLAEEDYDAIVIAAAGLIRLGRTDAITEYFDPTAFVPAIGQGTLAVEYKKTDTKVEEMLKSIQDADTALVVGAESAFSERIGGGCKLPVGCYAQHTKDGIALSAVFGSEDGTRIAHRSMTTDAASVVEAAHDLADQLRHDIDD